MLASKNKINNLRIFLYSNMVLENKYVSISKYEDGE
jgi:hypothetical protein